jgi:hypothetical protein
MTTTNKRTNTKINSSNPWFEIDRLTQINKELWRHSRAIEGRAAAQTKPNSPSERREIEEARARVAESDIELWLATARALESGHSSGSPTSALRAARRLRRRAERRLTDAQIETLREMNEADGDEADDAALAERYRCTPGDYAVQFRGILEPHEVTGKIIQENFAADGETIDDEAAEALAAEVAAIMQPAADDAADLKETK